MFGFQTGENLFLDGARWDAGYRPLSLAIGPFLIGRPAGGEGPGQVHIDMEHPRIAVGGVGIRLFDENGLATPYLDEIAERLGDLDEGSRESRAFFDALLAYDLLKPFSLLVTIAHAAVTPPVGSILFCPATHPA